MGLIGHNQIREQLCSQLNKQKLPSCLLFWGPEGIGKKKVAYYMVQYANCTQNKNRPCGVCGSCIRVLKKESESLFELIPVNQTIRVDETREAIRFFDLKNINQSRFIIIDQAEHLNVQASNALLKTLEEPPENSYIILITAYPWKLLPTILSRAVSVRFNPLSTKEMRQILSSFPEWAIKMAQGSPGKAIELVSYADQGIREQSWEIIQTFILKHDEQINDQIIKKLFEKKITLPHKNNYLNYFPFLYLFLRDLYVSKFVLNNINSKSDQLNLLKDFLLNVDKINEIINLSSYLNHNVFINQLHQLIDLENKLKNNTDVTLGFESLLMENHL